MATTFSTVFKLNCAILAAMAFTLWFTGQPARADGSLTPALVLFNSAAATADTRHVEATISAAGGRVTHKFPGQALIAQLPAGVTAQLTGLPGVAGVYTDAVDLAAIDAFGPGARQLAAVWNSLFTPQLDAAAAEALDARQPEHPRDMFTAPKPAADIAAAATSIRPGYYETSEFMAGSVAVGIVLLESNGSAEASTENWTSDEKQLVLSEIVGALNWWAQREPRANLSFVYDDHATNPLPITVEPINHTAFDATYGEPRWVGEAMRALGYTSSNYFMQVYNYNNALRAAYNTDWAFTIFVVDSAVDTDNKFADGYFAYAYLGGPFMVMTSENNGYGAYNMDAVAAHEMGHIFYALDQYASAYQGCTLTAGYLAIPNQNSQYGTCASNVTSIMRGQIYPYTAKAIDQYAAGQIGWRDSDSDNILDPLDVSLPITFTGFVQQQAAITVTGSASMTPYPSPNGSSFTINQFATVKYRFDGGSWQTATIDSLGTEAASLTFHFTAAGLAAGSHTLEVTAVDSAGNFSSPYATKTFSVAGLVDGGVNTQLNPVSGSTVTGVAYSTGSGTIANVEYRVDAGTWQPATPQDGAFNSNYEPFTINLADIQIAATQPYTLEARAIDNTGYIETAPASTVIQPGGGQQYSVFVPIIIH